MSFDLDFLAAQGFGLRRFGLFVSYVEVAFYGIFWFCVIL